MMPIPQHPEHRRRTRRSLAIAVAILAAAVLAIVLFPGDGT